MTYEIFKTDNYLLVVDDSKIKEGDYRMNIQRGYVKLVDDAPEYYNQRNDVFKKVIAHLPLNNSPILEGVPLLPPLEQEDDVEYIANKLTQHLTYPSERREGIILGYNKAKEKYRFTEEDIKKAIYYGQNNNMPFFPSRYTEFIQSLTQPKMPVGFECEMELCEETCEHGRCKTHGCANPINGDTIKTTTNSQGQTILVGKYIY
jgi:hypothetical protein